jgi:3-hydroxyisobutyrate dehydrogenase-like beta-hydroxyacid dehydrogenase
MPSNEQAFLMNLAFVGLGQMGFPMAINMLKSGAKLTVSSASGRRHGELESQGAKATRDPADIACADIVFLCLPGTEQVRETLFGPHGIASLMGPSQIIVDTSTVDYLVTREFAVKLGERGIGFIDAPVSGMEKRAIEGTLTAMCGGRPETLEQVKPYLSCVANSILHMGDAGSGQLAKLINQLLFNINCAAIAEVLPMAAKLGIDPEKIGRIINSGTGRSYASEFFIPRILDNNFSDGYPLKHAYKDVESGAKVGASHGIPLPVLAAASATSSCCGTSECLDWMIPLSELHLRSILTEWVAHYDRGRPHSRLGPGVPDPPGRSTTLRA